MRIVAALHVKVTDIARAKKFYEGLLGLELTQVSDAVCNARIGDFTLVLSRHDRPASRAAVAFVVDDLASRQATAAALGGKTNVSGYAPIAPAVVIDDPDGNHLEFVSLPPGGPIT
jgi:predicted enzyme related to lactoylglutathione lyase